MTETTTATVQTIIDSMTGAFTTGSQQMMTAISSIVPVVLPVMIGMVVVGLGIRVFKKIAGR